MISHANLVNAVDVPIVKLVPRNERQVSKKYLQRIEASLRAVGLIDPFVVFRQGDNYEILDGGLRYPMLLEMGVETVPCIVANQREAFTPNRMVNQLTASQEMRMLRKSLEAGSWGFSTGLQYVPQKYAKTDEITELAKVMHETGGIYATHMRSEEDDLIPATQEAIRIARGAGVPLNIAHLKANGRNNWRSMPEVIRLVEDARAGGLKVTADMYPYDKSATTTLASVLLVPAEQTVKSVTELEDRLRDGVTRDAIRILTEKGRPGETNWVAKGGWNYFSIVNAPKHPEVVGRMFIDLAKEQGVTPFDVAADLVIAEGEDVIISLSTMIEENLKLQMVQPWVMFSSDGYAVAPGEKGVHPRNYGSQARVLRKYVREEKVLTLEEAVHKMTGLPASTLGLTDRGLIRTGFKADLVIFDPVKVNDPATYLDPHHFAEGVNTVIVNGAPVVENGKFLEKYAGKVLRR